MSVFVPSEGTLSVRVFDASGRLVRTLQESTNVPRGFRELAVDGSDGRGTPLASEIYFLWIETAAESITQRVTIVR